MAQILATALALGFGAAAAAQDVEPNDDFDSARSLACGGVVNGSLGVADPRDFFRITGVAANTILHVDVQTSGTCIGGSSQGATCTDYEGCPGGFCAKPTDLDLVGYDGARSEAFFLSEPFIDGEADPVGTIPLRNTEPATLFLELLRVVGSPPTTPYTLTVGCAQPQPLGCPTDFAIQTQFDIDPVGDMDVFAFDMASNLGPRRLNLDIDASGLLLGDPRESILDSALRVYDPWWNLVASSAENLAPNDDPNDEEDAFIRAHVFEPGTYFVAISCVEDEDFVGCPIVACEPGLCDPAVDLVDLEYELSRRCRTIPVEATDCSVSGPPIEGEIRPQSEVTSVEVDYFRTQVAAADLITLDIDTVATSQLDSVVGLFRPTGIFLDGQPLSVEDEQTCDFDTEACNDDGFAPDDAGQPRTVDSYLEYCAAETGPVVIGISNFADFDFNGLDDFDHTDGSFIIELIGPYTLTARCGKADRDQDTVTDCLDNCPLQADPSQADRDGDGIGDLCQCGDVDGDGLKNVVDALRIARGELTPADPEFDKCDVDGAGRCVASPQISCIRDGNCPGADTCAKCNVADALSIAKGRVSSDRALQRCPAHLHLPGT